MANTQLTQTGAQVQADLNLTENLQQAFSTSSTYAVGDMVVYDGKLWRCITAVSSAGSWTGSSNWAQIDLKHINDPIIDVSSLPNSCPNPQKFYRMTTVGEHIKRGIPSSSKAFANVMFNTDLNVEEVMNIISQPEIPYYEGEEEYQGMTLNIKNYNIVWSNSGGNDDNIITIFEIVDLDLGSGPVDVAVICNWTFVNMLLGDTPSGTPLIFWCSNGDIASALTSGAITFTGWNPQMSNPIEVLYFVNQISTSGNSIVANDLLTDLVYCTKFTTYKAIDKIYEDGDSSSAHVGVCDNYFKSAYNTDLILFDINDTPTASDIYQGIMNGEIPYQINDNDLNDTKVLTALFAPVTSFDTYEPYTNSTLYIYAATITISEGTPTISSQVFADAQTIFSALLEEQLGVFTIDTSLKKSVSLHHYKDGKWYEAGEGGGIESDILYDHIATLEQIIAQQKNKIIVTNNGAAVVFTVQAED